MDKTDVFKRERPRIAEFLEREPKQEAGAWIKPTFFTASDRESQNSTGNLSTRGPATWIKPTFFHASGRESRKTSRNLCIEGPAGIFENLPLSPSGPRKTAKNSPLAHLSRSLDQLPSVTPYCLRLISATEHYLLPTTYHLLPTTYDSCYYPLPTACCLLPAACYLLPSTPTTCYLLPTTTYY